MQKNDPFTNKLGWKVFLGYLLLVWLVWYLKFFQFGYYEDDYWYAVIPANMSFREMLSFVWNNLINFEGNQGRFIGYTVPFFLTHIFYQLGGLPMVYVFGILLVSFNAYLFYLVVSSFGNWWLGVFAGLVFIVYPADSTKILIVHIYQLQLSLMFALLAFHFYRRKVVLSYLLAFASLITYENAFLAFIFIPFLHRNFFHAGNLKRWILHLIVVFFFILVAFLVRKFTGEAKVSAMGSETLPRVFLSLIYGPIVGLYSYFQIPYEAIQQLNSTWPVIVWLFLAQGLVVWIVRKRIFFDEVHLHKPGLQSEWAKFPNSYLYLCIIGLFMLSVGYLLAFTHFPPTELSGRGTSVHLGATFGSVLFFISAWSLLFSIIRKKQIRYILAFILMGWISLLGSRALLVQNDYVSSWEIQKELYDQIFSQAPDMDDGDIILLESRDKNNTKYIDTYSWPLPNIPELLIDFPVEFKPPPRILFAETSPDSLFHVSDSILFFTPRYPFLYDNQDTVYISSNNLIYFQIEKGQVFRREEHPFFNEYGVIVKNIPDPMPPFSYKLQPVARDFLLK